MGIQSSVNALMQQLYTIGAIGAGLREQKKQTKGQEKTANEAKIQTDIAAGNAPMKDGKADPEWLQKRREQFERNKNNVLFYPDGKLSTVGKARAKILEDKIKGGGEFKLGDIGFYTDSRVQEYLKSFAANPKMKNEVASDLARGSVEARTNSINQSKADFNAHTASLIKYYSKGSGNP